MEDLQDPSFSVPSALSIADELSELVFFFHFLLVIKVHEVVEKKPLDVAMPCAVTKGVNLISLICNWL